MRLPSERTGPQKKRFTKVIAAGLTLGSFLLPSPQLLADLRPPRRVAVVGASNTITDARMGIKSYVDYLRELCPEAEFLVRAQMGASPNVLKQLVRQLKNEQTDPIDLIIIEPSGNQVWSSSYIGWINSLVHEAHGGIVKKVAVLSVGPRFRHPNLTLKEMEGHPEDLTSMQSFNYALLSGKLESSPEIDFTVDLAIPLATTRFGCSYCQPDRYHWSRMGDRRVASTLYLQIFRGTTSTRDDLPRTEEEYKQFVQQARTHGCSKP